MVPIIAVVARDVIVALAVIDKLVTGTTVKGIAAA
jgi:hypothetical protein